MRRRKTLIEQRAEAVLFQERIDIHQCQMCGERLVAHTEEARNGDKDVHVYCPNCDVSVASECRADEVPSTITYLCEAHAQLARQARANSGILNLPKGLSPYGHSNPKNRYRR